MAEPVERRVATVCAYCGALSGAACDGSPSAEHTDAPFVPATVLVVRDEVALIEHATEAILEINAKPGPSLTHHMARLRARAVLERIGALQQLSSESNAGSEHA